MMTLTAAALTAKEALATVTWSQSLLHRTIIWPETHFNLHRMIHHLKAGILLRVLANYCISIFFSSFSNAVSISNLTAVPPI